MNLTLHDKIWNDHLVDEQPDGPCLLYVDRQIAHEVDSPQAFAGLRRAGLRVKAPEKTLLVVDHNVPTSDRSQPNPDPESAAQIAYFAENARLFGLEYYDEPASVTCMAGNPCAAITRANSAFGVPGRIAAVREARSAWRRDVLDMDAAKREWQELL